MDNNVIMGHHLSHGGPEIPHQSGGYAAPLTVMTLKGHTMLTLMDAFAQTVEEARQRLIRAEGGRNISHRELARRAGVNHRTLSYNLNPDRPATGRRIDRDLIAALARVLPVSEEDLVRAAQVAAGYQVREPDFPDLGSAVTRYLNDGDVPESEKRRLRARLADILADEMRKAAENRNGQ